MRAPLALALFAVLTASACSSPDGEPSARISRAIHASACGPSAMVDLAQAAPFAWDHVVILTPYADQEVADRALGRHWLEFGRYADALNSEGTDVLVFLRDGQIVRATAHRRVQGDFADALQGRSVPRDRARFRAHDAEAFCRFPHLDIIG